MISKGTIIKGPTRLPDCHLMQGAPARSLLQQLQRCPRGRLPSVQLIASRWRLPPQPAAPRRALSAHARPPPLPIDPGPFSPAPFNSLRLDLTAPAAAAPAGAAAQLPPAALPACLAAALPAWRAAGVNAVFLSLALPAHGALLSALVGPQGGFELHHARGCAATLFAWLPGTPCKVPPYAGTQVAVGGVCVDGAGRLLLIRERHAPPGTWKFPGGMADLGEDLPRCAVREVWEETGVRTRFEGLLGFRHMHGAAFGVSDLYFLALLRPLRGSSSSSSIGSSDCDSAALDAEVRPDPGEVAECGWRDGAAFAAATPHALMARAARDGLAAAQERGWLQAAGGGSGSGSGGALPAAPPALLPAAPPALLHLSPVYSPVSRRWTQCFLGGEAVAAVPRGVDRGAVPAQPEAPAPWEQA